MLCASVCVYCVLIQCYPSFFLFSLFFLSLFFFFLFFFRYRPRRTIYLCFGHDEEVGGAKGAAHIAAHFRRLGVSFDFMLGERVRE